ncbi:hypothetical protein [Corallococcus coralloides]|uniref:hypothetical protein n=1 Tax=Corallococcus coralloides TaxID=184914 RepID=UPI0011D1E077|nr:hypothetical protein [Corallococcus coralloides]
MKLETRLRKVQEHLHRETQRVEELANRVERVEGVVFSGRVTPHLANELSKAPHSFSVVRRCRREPLRQRAVARA